MSTTKIKGIDISYHDGTIDFKKVVDDGVKFIVLRSSKRNTTDTKFLEYVKQCKKYKIPIMVYHFIYTDGATPKQNAQCTVNSIKKAGLDHTSLWISADLEYDTWKKNKEKCTRAKCTKYTKEYLDELKRLGCKKLFIYTNDDYYENYYDWSQLKGYPIWFAKFGKSTPKYNCSMFQYSETGKVAGIKTKVDMNWLYDEQMYKDAKNSILGTTTTAAKQEQKTETKKETATTPAKKATGKVTANYLNIRSGAGKDHKTLSIGPLKKNELVDIYDSAKAKDGNTWYKVIYKNTWGYVSAKFIEKITTETKKDTNTTTIKKTVSDKYVKYINSTGTHYISNCSHDERGKWSSGKAGDQKGDEWCMRSWYNRPWNYVLRYPDQKVRQKIAELGIDAALNNKIGYDQNQRNTYWTQLKKNKYDPSKITENCEADCSAGVVANVKAVGFLLGLDNLKYINASYTGDMRKGFKNAGFKVLTDSKYTKGYEYLLPGDILLYENHHTATNVTKGKKA